MKKIIPVVALLGVGLLATGCSNQGSHTLSIDNTVKEFDQVLTNYTALNDTTNTVLDKYQVSLSSDLENSINSDNNANNTPQIDVNSNNLANDENSEKLTNLDKRVPNTENADNQTNTEILDNSQTLTETEQKEISTLYYLTNDIENYSTDYIKLKENLTSAIEETENLLAKVRNKELELNAEQRMMLSTQSAQLKNLGKELSRSTRQLGLQLSDLNELLASNDNSNNLSLKYLALLNNLVDGNELLENGLASLMLINQTFYANNESEQPINKGKIMYGFKRKGEDAKIEEYEINNDVINKVENNNSNDITSLEASEEPKNKLESNIDSYGNNYRNIDSFFNTALLDNQFMYGGNGYGMNGFMGGYNPYVYNNMTNNNASNNQINRTNSLSNNNEKQNNKFAKNIDTYKDKNTPSLLTRLKNFKAHFKASKPKVRNPASRYQDENNNI